MLKAVKVVGLNSDTEAALALISPVLPLDENKLSLHLYLVVYCFLDDAFSLARQALADSELVFSQSLLPIPERLSEVLQSILKSLAGAESVQVLAGCYEQNSNQEGVFYLVTRGQDLIARLVRDKEFTDLGSMSGEGQLVSGFFKTGDRVILSTANVKEFLHEDLSELANLSIDLIEDEIASHLPDAKVSPLAIVVLEDKVEEALVKDSQSQPPDRVVVEDPESGINQSRKFTLKLLPIKFKISSKALFVLILATLVLLGLIVGYLKFVKNRTVTPAETPINSTQPTQTPTPANIYQISDFPIWLDLDLIKSGMNADGLSASNGKILVLDTNKEVLVEIDLNSKSPQLLAGQDKLGQGKFASLNGDIAWVYSDDKGIVRVDTGNQTAASVIKKDSMWGDIGGMIGFGGNVYLLDKSKSQIWKYVPIASGYSDKIAYFKDGTTADLSQFVKFEIDSSVWILKRGAQIDRFTQGAPDFFSFSGLDKPVKNLKTFFVSDEAGNAYFLDAENNRLLVTDKKGQYIAQYQSDKFQTFSDFVVDESGKKAYFLSGSKIYQMDLK